MQALEASPLLASYTIARCGMQRPQS
uniref:Uncharacterized protein n=1 Tax=Arundo donax TaxID=35708 RepID=A0A0A9A765_ARUDO